MTATTWYRAGTATVTNNSRPVVGVNTAWLSQVSAGDLFAVTDANGNLTSVWAEIESVTDDTHLTLKAIWPAATASGAKYAILRNFTGTQPADLAARLSKLIAQYQITVDEMQTLLASGDMVTLTTLTGGTVQVQGLLGIAQQSVPAHEAKTGAHPISGVTGLPAALDAKLNTLNPTSSGTMTHSGSMSATRISSSGVTNHVTFLEANIDGAAFGYMDGSYADATYGWIYGQNSANGDLQIRRRSGSTISDTVLTITRDSAVPRFVFGDTPDDGSTLMQGGGGARFDGNLGIGATPSAWQSGWRAIEFGGGCGIASDQLSATHVSSNAIYTGSGWVRRVDGYSANCYSQNGEQYWRTAGSGTAGSAISWTQAMTLTHTGRMLLGPVTDDGSTLMQVGGGARFTGNVGIGVTPPIMSGSSVAAQRAVFGSLAGGPYSHAHMASNCYPSGSNDPGSATWRYNSGATGDLGDATLYEQRSRQHYFRVAATQGLAGEAITWNTAVVIDSSGNLLAGVWSGSCHTLWKTAAAEVGNGVLDVGGANSTAIFYSVSSFSPNSANAAVKLGRDATTGRSINAGGTINASGADYAEYERNNGATITKGDIVGFNVDGVLTTKFDDALSFGVKSTDPCMVGGDVWGTEDQVGKRPEQPQFTAPEYAGSQAPADLLAKPVEPSLGIPAEPSKQEGETKAVFAARKAWWQQACQAAEAQHLQAQADYADALAAWSALAGEHAAALAQYQADQSAHQAAVEAAKTEFDTETIPAYKKALAEFESALEAARVQVDRVAYSGKVPVNVLGANPGDYIMAVRADDGGIAGVAVGEDEISFAQYRKAVGRVRRIEPDGRALIAVIVH